MTLHEVHASGTRIHVPAFADECPAILYVAGADGFVQWVNRRACDVTGLHAEALLGDRWLRAVHPSDSSAIEAAWYSSIASGQPFSQEFRLPSPTDGWQWVMGKAEAVRNDEGAIDHWVGTLFEIGEMKEIERALLKSELRFRALTDNVEQIIFISDDAWSVTYLNRRFTEFTGMGTAQALGEGWLRAVPAQEVEFIRTQLHLAVATGSLSNEHRLYHAPSGEFRWQLVRAHRVGDLTGAHTQWFGTITDIHDQKLALQRKNEALDAFQVALLPRQISPIPECNLSTLYISASEEARIGGDWYDCFDLGEGIYGISIGDVVGHGLEASAAMSRIRQYISATAEDGCDPVSVMERTNAFVIRRGLPLATAIFGLLDTRTRCFRFCAAGHPRPIVVSGERAELLDCDGMALGVTPDAQFSACEVDLVDASMLVLYTDGVLEFSRDLISAERELLVSSAVTARLRNPASRAGEIVRRTMRGWVPNDDVAMLVLAFGEEGGTTVSHRAQTLMSWQFDSQDSSAAYRVREQVLLFLRELAHPDQELFEVKAVIGELIANVVEHAPGPVHFEVDWSGERAIMRMRDSGPGFTARAVLPPDPMSESGRGLYLIAALADDLRAASHFEGGTEVSVRLRLHKHHAG